MAAICVSYVWQILFSQREGHGPNPRLPTKMRVWRDFQDVKDRSKGRLPVGGDSHGEGKVTRVLENSCGAATTLRLALQRDGVGEPAPRGRNHTAGLCIPQARCDGHTSTPFQSRGHKSTSPGLLKSGMVATPTSSSLCK